METKLFCLALLLVHLVTFSCGQTSAVQPNGAEGTSVNGSDLNITSHVQNISSTNPVSNYNSSLSTNTTRQNDATSVKPANNNSTDVSPVKNENSTEQRPTPTPTVPLKNSTSTSHTSPPINQTFTSPAYTPSSTPPSSNHTNTSNHSVSPPLYSTASSNWPNHTETFSPTSGPMPKVLNSTMSSTPTGAPPGSTANTSSLLEAPSTHPPTVALQTSRRTQTSSTSQPLNSTSTQARIHSESPSQLNKGGNTAEHHDSPGLDPLLAGLVSAFIITAVIIMLLIFLKLRRRDSGPEFRRLQEVPMDDMEETPLYSY